MPRPKIMIPLPEKPKVISKENNRTVFEIAPLYPGYGVTIGNSLRRVLISSLEGAAIVSVKIKGVGHEFSTIEHVKEDVMEILMNLKKVRVKLLTDGPATLELKAKGEKKIKAKDMKASSEIKIISPEQHIATLTDKNASLEMEMSIEKGTGYEPIEQRQREKLSIGTITIDGIFSPIKTVNFEVKNIRVGQRTDYNKIIIDITTDGTMKPEEALEQAAQIIISQFGAIKFNDTKISETATKTEKSKVKEPEGKKVKKTALKTRSKNTTK